MLELVTPSARYAKSYQDAYYEQLKEDPTGYLHDFVDEKNVSEVIRVLAAWSRGEELPEGYLPSTAYWLVESDQFIGGLSIRHTLNQKLREEGGHIGYIIRPSARRKGYGTTMLRLALPKAYELGINPVLITCNRENTASRKIIEANGGILENSVKHDGIETLRFWVATK